MLSGSRRALAEVTLLFITLLWGVSFPLIRFLVGTPHEHGTTPEGFLMGPVALAAWRFAIAGTLVLVLAVLDRAHRLNELAAGAAPHHTESLALSPRFGWHVWVLSLLLVVSFAAQAIGMTDTTAANSALITGLNVVFVPFLAPLVGRLRPPMIIYIAAMVAFAGIAMLTDVRKLEMPRSGDLWTLFCAVTFALHLIYVAVYTPHHRVLMLAAGQLVVSAVLFFMLAAARGESLMLPWPALLPVLVLAIGCTAFPLVGSTWAQRHLSESHAALIYSLEPVAGAALGILILGEYFGPEFLLGGTLVIAGILMARPRDEEPGQPPIHLNREAGLS